MTAPNRRWFRFTLRTLFMAVTGVACWLGWHVRTVKQRRDMRRWIEEGGGQASVFYPPQPTSGELSLIILTGERPDGDDFAIPWIRKLFGDEPVWRVEVRSDASEDDIARARQLFPETEVFNIRSKPIPGAGFF